MPRSPDLRRCNGGRAGEAGVSDRRDARAKAFGCAEPGDRDHVLGLEPLLAPDMGCDPGPEGQPVAEPGVARVLDVGMGVHEAGDDHAALVALSCSQLGRAADRGDAPVVPDRDGSVTDRVALDGHDPVGGDDLCHHVRVVSPPSSSAPTVSTSPSSTPSPT